VEKIKAIWSWFLDGLTEAVIACADHMRTRRTIRLLLDTKPASLRDASGKELAQVRPPQIEPADARQKLKGVPIDIVVPESLVLRRDLNQISAESAPFVEAFARHQIERVTPWKAADTYFGVATTRLPGKPPKLAVSIHVVARRLIAEVVGSLSELNPVRLRLLLYRPDSPDPIIVPVTEQKSRQMRIRRMVQTFVLCSFFLIAARLVLLSWQITSLQSNTADIDAQIEDQREALATAHTEKSAGFTGESLAAMRKARPRAVETLEAMSAALPDDAYLLSFQLVGDELHISGVSTQTSDLVPALEGSKRFVDVNFAAATTRLEDGSANRFHLAMRVAPRAGLR